MKFKSAIFICFIAAMPSFANTIANWTFDASVPTPTSVDANASASNFTLSSGSTSYFSGNPSTGKGISGTGWNGSSNGKWWEFTVTADAGYVLDLTTLTFDDLASSQGAASWFVAINGNTVGSTHSTHTTTFTTDTVDLSAYQGLLSADIQIFGFGAASANGTWRLDNVTLSGLSSPVPDSLPFGFSMAAFLSVLILSRNFPRFNAISKA